MLCLISEWGPCPPGGYRYVFPEDGFEAHAWTYVDWVAVARSHVYVNKYDRPNLEKEMQHQYCLTLPPGFCLYDDPNRPRPNTSLEWNDVMEGVKTFGLWIAKGAKYVSQAEADRRATVCSRCYLNVHVQGCTACHAAVQEIVRNKHTKLDNVLRTCAVCKCFLRAKVHFPISILDRKDPGVQGMYPEFCWLNKESENYRED